MRSGADCGGTFTDVVSDGGVAAKVPSSRYDPAAAVARGFECLGAGRPGWMAHGTTVATNAVVERAGARVALVTTAGFADVIEIARQTRPSLYDQFADPPEPLVGRGDRLEVAERVAGTGETLIPVGDVPQPAAGVDAVAVCLLHADLHPGHETEVAEELRRRGWDVTASHELAPEFREYERTSTTVLNAYVRPICGDYLEGVGELADSVSVMSSSGGLLPVATAAAQPARLLLSGPAGGVRAAAAYAAVCGYPGAVSFDMGGTSTDVCLIRDGRPASAGQRGISGLPVRLPSLDIHTIGAGGGSIARLDAGGALVVGPRSAGAEPGPACYGRGGTQPTVTDADLVAGRIPPGRVFGGLTLDPAAAVAALDGAGLDALGVIDVVDAAMEGAVRVVTVEQGVDPRECALVAFGGAGPLHAAAIADALGMAAVVVPPRAGVLSAVGLLCAPGQRDLVRSWGRPTDHDGARRAAARLAAEGVRSLGGSVDDGSADGIAATLGFDCRYAGQSHELTVVDPDRFDDEHERRNGFRRSEVGVEVVAVRAVVRSRPSLSETDLPVPDDRRDVGSLDGPGSIAEDDCTIWVPEGWRADSGPAGCLVLRRVGQP